MNQQKKKVTSSVSQPHDRCLTIPFPSSFFLKNSTAVFYSNRNLYGERTGVHPAFYLIRPGVLKKSRALRKGAVDKAVPQQCFLCFFSNASITDTCKILIFLSLREGISMIKDFNRKEKKRIHQFLDPVKIKK